MGKTTLTLFAVSMSAALALSAAVAAETLPDYALPVPENEAHRDYLGLSVDSGEFMLTDIDADVLLIELFSMYCPYCQAEAPLINTLYEKMNDMSAGGTTVKIIGLGASNSAFEVDTFREGFAVEFPLFPDPDMTMYNGLKGEGTPGFIGSKKEADGSWTIVLRQSGGFYDADDFLAELLERSGMNR